MSAPPRGLGLIEVLVGGAIGSVIVAGSMKSLQLSLESAQVVRSSLSESELRFSLAQILTNEEDCKANLKPTADNVPDPKAVGLYGAKRDWGRGEVVQLKKNIGNNVAGDASTEADDILLVEQGVSFKGDLNIVKMVLKGSSAEDDNNNPKKGLRTRTFVVYYRKEGMGSFSTLGGEDCTESDQQGCYFNQCQVEYQLQDQANPEVTKCQVADCVNYGSGGSGGQVNCYHADTNEGTGAGKTLVGCGDTDIAKGTNTTAFGYGAGKVNTGAHNTFIGFKAGHKTTDVTQTDGTVKSGENNTFIGSVAGLNNTTGTGNTFIGTQAGNKNTTAYGNTVIGAHAGFENQTGVQNTAIGMNAGNKNTGPNNTFIGYAAGTVNSSGDSNTFIGSVAGLNNTTGTGNTFIGMNSGNKNVTTSNNTFVGTNAGFNNTGGDNTFVGLEAGRNTTSNNNTFIGLQAGKNHTSGGNNTTIGYKSGFSLTTGTKNTVIGTSAGHDNITGLGNTFIGFEAGKKTTRSSNTFIGYQAGLNNTTGWGNTAIGHESGKALTGAGTQNTLIGQAAGSAVTTGHSNTIVGRRAGQLITTGDHNIILGKDVRAPSRTGNHQLNIGNLIVGKRANAITTPPSIANNEIKVLGDLKVCDTNGRNCKRPLFSGADVTLGTLTVNTIKVDTLKPKNDTRILVTHTMVSRDRFVAPALVTTEFHARRGSCNDTGCSGQSGVLISGKSDSGYGTVWANKLYASNKKGYAGEAGGTWLSSRVYKKNIVPYEDLEKSLQHIINTPLFTYQYKEDLPNKTRMGIISEELPSFLQLRRSFVTPSGGGAVLSHNHKGKPHIHAVEGKKHSSDDSQKVKSKTKIRLKSKVAPSQPDWVSIYGTLWAGIKALFQKFKAFQENTIQEISHIKKQLKALDSKAQKQALELTKQASQMLKEIMDLKAQFKETKKQVEKSQKELSTKAKEQSQNITQLQKELSTKTKEQSQTITQLQKEQDSKIQAQAQTIAKQAQAIEQLKLALEKQSELTDQLKKEHQKLTADLEK